MTTKKNNYERFMRESNAIEGEMWDERYGVLHANDVDACEWFLQLREIEEEELLHLHQILYEGRPKPMQNLLSVGEYRRCNLSSPVGTPMWQMVQPLMDGYFQRWNDMNAWEAHWRFEKIHPFEDLNGRTGRLLWLWKAVNQEKYHFSIPFLKEYYYQTLSNMKRI